MEKKRRLLVLTSTFPRWENDTEPGFVFELASRLSDHFEVRVLAPHAGGAATSEVMAGLSIHRYRYAPEPLETLAHGGGIMPNLKRHPWKWVLVPALFVAQLLAIRRELKDWRPDAIHAHWIIPQGLAAVLALGPRKSPVRLVTTSHGADLFSLKWRLFRGLKAFVLRRSDCITVVSHVMREIVLDLGIDPGKVIVAAMGVDLVKRFVPDPDQQRSTDEILFVGRLVEKKGLRHLLDAMPSIAQVHPTVRLTVVGFGPEEDALREQAALMGLSDRVKFAGPVAQANLPALYRRSAVFVAPFVEAASGDQEGLGLVVVEAIGCGSPVVVSDLPAVRDVLDEDAGDWRVEPSNSSALAAAILRVLADPVGARGRSVLLRQGIAARFDWNEVVRHYSSLLGHAPRHDVLKNQDSAISKVSTEPLSKS